MKSIICDKLPRIIKNKRRLEKILEVKITNKGKEVFIDGEPENEYFAEKVIDALNFGFPFSASISIKTEETAFEKLNIKEFSRTQNFKRVRARIIGQNGKTLKTISELTKCFLELKDNEIGIIGLPEDIFGTRTSLISLIKGAKTANVYAYLERHHPLPIVDLGIKEIGKKL